MLGWEPSDENYVFLAYPVELRPYCGKIAQQE